MFILNNLSIGLKDKKIVKNVSFKINNNNVLSLLGESGSGKSLTARAIMGLLDKNLYSEGEMILGGENISSDEKKAQIRGKKTAIVFQDALNSLNPQIKVGEQITEILRYRLGYKKRESIDKCREIMQRVGLTPWERIYNEYPHNLSGGMAQRALIASMIIGEPELIILDEPTTALDIITQKEILKLLKSLLKNNVKMLFITHNIEVARYISDDIIIMYKGEIVERGKAKLILDNPFHPYSIILKESVAKINRELKNPCLSEEKIIDASCPFYQRCIYRSDICKNEVKEIIMKDRIVRCNREFIYE